MGKGLKSIALHEESNDNGTRDVNFAESKNLVVKSTGGLRTCLWMRVGDKKSYRPHAHRGKAI